MMENRETWASSRDLERLKGAPLESTIEEKKRKQKTRRPIFFNFERLERGTEGEKKGLFNEVVKPRE